MKKALLPLGALALLGLVAIPLLGGKGEQALPPGLERLRGTPAWFEGPDGRITLPMVEVQLQGPGAPRLMLGLVFECRGGLDANVPPVLDKNGVQRVRDALMTDLGTMTPEAVGESSRERFALKRRILSVIESAAFPHAEARVTRVHFESLLFAGGA
ncbi:MAG: flagellar basal body-associated FliL family protein [Planctomycetes bacterium]|nr:flagellar basal body-associated FliL family protein [Planctomycetota bacterium]